MKCRKLEPTQMVEERAQFEKRRCYEVSENGRAIVRFQFNLALEDDRETLFIIFSKRTRATIYKGPYKRSLSLEMDATLAEDDGYDGLEFYLLQGAQKQLCSWANERGYPYWRPGAEISIAFLQEGEFDNDGLLKEHNVTIH